MGASPMAGTSVPARLPGLQNEPSVGPVAPAVGPQGAKLRFRALSCAFMRFPTEQPESARKLQKIPNKF